MLIISSQDFRPQLSELLRVAERGEEIYVTRSRKACAKLIGLTKEEKNKIQKYINDLK